MAKHYPDKDEGFFYFNLLKKYTQNPHNSVVSAELQYLKSIGVPEDDQDTFFFLNQLMEAANKSNDKKTVIQIREISNRMKNTSGSSMMRTVILEDSLKTKTDCIELIEECFKNDLYESALESIVDFIKREKDILIAVSILQVIASRTEEMGIADKSRVAIQFIERIDNVLKKDACIRREEGIFGKYYALNWHEVKDKDFKKYLDVRSGFTRTKFEVKKEESQTSKNKKFIKACQLETPVKKDIDYEAEFSVNKIEIAENGNGELNYTLHCILRQRTFHEEPTSYTVLCRDNAYKMNLSFKDVNEFTIKFTAPQLAEVSIGFIYKYYGTKYRYKCVYKFEENDMYEVNFFG